MTGPRITVVGSINLDFVASAHALPRAGERAGALRGVDRVLRHQPVADRLGRETESWPARQQAILGVPLQQQWRHRR